MAVGVVQMMISTHHDGLLTLYWREKMWLMDYYDSGCYACNIDCV